VDTKGCPNCRDWDEVCDVIRENYWPGLGKGAVSLTALVALLVMRMKAVEDERDANAKLALELREELSRCQALVKIQ
jgi:hypothetical protein